MIPYAMISLGCALNGAILLSIVYLHEISSEKFRNLSIIVLNLSWATG